MKHTGVITSNQADSLPIWSTLNFNTFPFVTKIDDWMSKIQNWEVANGIIFQIHFWGLEHQSITGSGVIVAPGIWLCAKHVIADYIEKMMIGEISCICTAIRPNNKLDIWKVIKITDDKLSDIVILGLTYITDIHDTTFYKAPISLIKPNIWEKVIIGGFRPKEYNTKQGDNIVGNLVLSYWEITEIFEHRRDSVMMPYPCFSVQSETLRWMSGWPVFNTKGSVIWILSTWFENDDISYCSLLWPCMWINFEWWWPVLFKGKIIDFPDNICLIEWRDNIVFSDSGDYWYKY